MSKTVFGLSLALGLLSLSASFAAHAGDEVCVVNKTSETLHASGVVNEANADASDFTPNNAYCMTVSLNEGMPLMAPTEGNAVISVFSPGGGQLDINITDPDVGTLDFSFDCKSGDCVSYSDAQKGDDGVYRVFVQ